MSWNTYCPHEIGELVILANDRNPESMWANTEWEKIEGRFLFAADSSHAVNSTGGRSSHSHTTQGHTLTKDQIPSHAHGLNGHTHSMSSHTHTYAKPNSPTGGPSTNTSGSTTLTVNQIPKHSHTFKWSDRTGGSGNIPLGGTATVTDWTCNETGGGQGHTHTLSSHTHTVGTASTNSGGPSTANTGGCSTDTANTGGGRLIRMATRAPRTTSLPTSPSTCGYASPDWRCVA